MNHPQQDLLDAFAAAALPAVIEGQLSALAGKVNPHNIGMMCYAIALGMLAAREQPEEAFVPKEAPKEEPKMVLP